MSSACSFTSTASTAATMVSLIAQRLHWIEARRTPGRIERGKERQHKRHHHHSAGFRCVHVGGQMREKIEFGREQLGVSEQGKELADALDIEANHHAEQKAVQLTYRDDQGASEQEHAQNGNL